MILGKNNAKAYKGMTFPDYTLTSTIIDRPPEVSRRTTTLRSTSVKNVASPGKSTMIQNERVPATTVPRPSKMNTHT